jgi:predicted nucleic acid-binding protein
MLVVDASCLYDVLVGKPHAEPIRQRLLADGDLAAPHIVDAEVLGVIRRDFLLGQLDLTAATQAVEDLRDWPGERFDHRALLERAWELRRNVRGWDALYVALAEALGAPLLTTDSRLARAAGPHCAIEVL